MSWTLRRAVPGDADALAAFARRRWPDRDPAFLARRWWMRASPAECHVAVDEDGAIGGICGGRRQRVWLGDREGRAVGICDWYVDDRARGARIGRALAEAALEGADLGWSLSLSEAAETAFRRIGWGPEPAARVPLWVAPTPVVALAGRRVRGIVEHRTFTSATLDEVLLRIAREPGDDRVHGLRDARAWREHLALVPARTYDLHEVEGGGAVVSRRLPLGAFPRLGPQSITLVADVIGETGVGRALAATASHALRHGSTVLVLPLRDARVEAQVARAGTWSCADGLGGVRLPRLGTRFMWKGREKAGFRVSALDCDFDLGFGSDRERGSPIASAAVR